VQGRVTAMPRPLFDREAIEAEIDRVRSLGLDVLRTLKTPIVMVVASRLSLCIRAMMIMTQNACTNKNDHLTNLTSARLTTKR
jgi:purine nucleoside phosphorylase